MARLGQTGDVPYASMTTEELIIVAKGIEASALALIPEWGGAGATFASIVEYSRRIEGFLKSIGSAVTSAFSEVNAEITDRTAELMNARNTVRQQAPEELARIVEVLVSRSIPAGGAIRYNTAPSSRNDYQRCETLAVAKIEPCDDSPVAIDLFVPWTESLPELKSKIEAAVKVLEKYNTQALKGLHGAIAVMVWINVALALIALIAYLILKIVEAVTGTVREIQTEIEKTEKEILLQENEIAKIKFAALAEDRALTLIEQEAIRVLEERIKGLKDYLEVLRGHKEEAEDWTEKLLEVVRESSQALLIFGGLVVASVAALIIRDLIKG
jgi:ABC-type multidrug transport system fused ATPase/permease subunit